MKNKWIPEGFKEAAELDESDFENIRNEYFKGVILYSFIALIVVGVLAFLGVHFNARLSGILAFPTAVCFVATPILFVRCILSLIVFIKILTRGFLFYEGTLQGTESGSLGEWGKKDQLFYIVDGKYLCNFFASPLYKSGTDVYLLYMQGFLEWFHMEGAVVKRKQ